MAPGTCRIPASAVDDEPRGLGANAQGGLRVSGTAGRIDWAVSAYRGIEPFGQIESANPPPLIGVPPRLVRSYPRFTMVGGDFETVRGAWGLRGELAAFVDDSFQTSDLRIAPGSSLDAGLAVDRKAGEYRVSATLFLHHESVDPLPGIPEGSSRNDVSLIGSADRSFRRDRYNLRTFAVFTPSESSAFLRAIATASVRDNVVIEASGGWFAGEGEDLTGRFAECDFAYVRLKYYF